MKKRTLKKSRTFLLCAMICILALAVSACGDSSDSGKKEYVKDSEISKVFKDPDAYSGKYIKISGKVFNTDRDGETLGLQCWYDVKNSDESFIVTKDTDEKYSEDDYIIADGKIQGEFKGENAFGAEITALQISADTIEKSTYQDVVAPTKEEKKVNKKATQYDVTMEVSKVEYADEETRIYVKVKNDSKYDVSIYLDSSSKVIQEGKQFEPETNYEADYPSIDEVAGGAEKEGILAVKALDPKKKAKLKVDVYSDNYEIDMKEFEIEF